MTTNSITNNPLIKTLPRSQRMVARFINLQESEADLAAQRIGQELITNTLPKSLFARSFVDLCDNAFREILENIIVYLGPKFVGEKLSRNLCSKGLENELKETIAKPASELLKENNIHNKKLMPVKAAIAVTALSIPLAEYALSYVKNLFTLKMFKQADFNNIANLNKNKQENVEHQEKVKQSAKKHIKLAGGIFAGCLAFTALLLTKGKNSKISTMLNHISEFILAPGSKMFKPETGASLDRIKKLDSRANFVNKYFGLDFRNKNGKLAISNGQVTACVVAGFFGYTGAAKDRGKQDYKEILYRFPLVGFYAISGNELFKDGFKKFMRKTNKCKELFEAEAQNKNNMPKLSELDDFAKKLAAKNGTTAEAEFKKLFKQKTTLIGIPVLFGFTVMGLFVAGCSRYFTQYRYNKDLKTQQAQNEKH